MERGDYTHLCFCVLIHGWDFQICSDPEALEMDSSTPEAQHSAERQVLPRLDEPCLLCSIRRSLK